MSGRPTHVPKTKQRRWDWGFSGLIPGAGWFKIVQICRPLQPWFLCLDLLLVASRQCLSSCPRPPSILDPWARSPADLSIPVWLSWSCPIFVA
eukprot:15459684-Alexandrium_andersonii.AAC.1